MYLPSVLRIVSVNAVHYILILCLLFLFCCHVVTCVVVKFRAWGFLTHQMNCSLFLVVSLLRS